PESGDEVSSPMRSIPIGRVRGVAGEAARRIAGDAVGAPNELDGRPGRIRGAEHEGVRRVEGREPTVREVVLERYAEPRDRVPTRRDRRWQGRDDRPTREGHGPRHGV